MPRGDPFSQLCQLAAALAQPIAADLHTHTTASDGDYTPSQVLAFAQQAKLKAVAITDHDTLAGYDVARKLESPVKLIPGVEITVMCDERETHLLAYGFDPDDDDLRPLLLEQCELRRLRFHAMLDLLRSRGIELVVGDILERRPSIGRGNLARLLVRFGHSPRELFVGLTVPPTPFIGIATAIEIVHHAGGIVSLAHPRSDATRADFEEHKFFGTDAIEVSHPAIGVKRRTELITWALELGFLTTGGSDCHGPGTSLIGSHGITSRELSAISAAGCQVLNHCTSKNVCENLRT
jgi:predicted metal-dependent phosphoesterase TrpH